MKSPAAARVPSVVAEFERRAARAEALSGETPASVEPLRFATGLYRAQAAAAAMLSAAPLTGHLDRDVDRIAAAAGDVVRFAAERGPELLREEALRRRDDTLETVRTRLLVYWTAERSTREDYLSRAILRPYVETLRLAAIAPARVHRRGQCPFCGGAPWIAVRRDGSAMEGARRALGCALCGGEWTFPRIFCPSCFEENPQSLPSFSDGRRPAVRLEACETCHSYVKSIDLSEDARPIPEVDDLCSLSLDLWASAQGFERIEPGLAGL